MCGSADALLGCAALLRASAVAAPPPLPTLLLLPTMLVLGHWLGQVWAPPTC